MASIVDLGSTDSTPTPTATASPTVQPTATATPTPTPSATPGSKKGKTESKKDSKDKPAEDPVTEDTQQAAEEQENANKASGDANTESLTGKVATPTPTPTPVPDSQVDPPSQDDPTFSLAEPGPAKAGVPNFFIDRFKIPPFLLPIYQAAGTEYGIRWEILAAINEIETNYGRLNNVTSSAGAQGWMQFMPATWKAYGVDGNKDGLADPYNPVDAIFSAARYLKAAGADKDLRAAIWAYNHADWYVDSVIMRAQVIGGMPTSLVSSLTGLTEGRFPVAAKATYADEVSTRDLSGKRKKAKNLTVEGDANRTGVSVYADAGAPVIAVSDVKVTKIGVSERLGRFIRVQDAYGNTYTYGRLAKISQQYAAPKPQKVDPAEVKRMVAEAPKDKKPTRAASSTDRPAPKSTTVEATPDATPATTAAAAAAGVPVKQRLFANPKRANAAAAGGAQQEFLRTGRVDGALTPGLALGLARDQIVIKKLREGSQVPAGTVLGRIGTASSKKHPHVRFEVRPAGSGAPRIDPKPILDGWKLLESTAIYRAQGANPFVAADAAATVGQILLMDKDTLIQRVLNNPRIEIYGCGRQDIQAGQIDRRVLAMLEFLVANGFNPTISSLQCGHSYLTASGNVSQHSVGSAVDIAAVNGEIISPSTQGKGSITEQVIQSLLTLQGNMKPDQIISLMKFKGADNTLAMGDHDDHIHVGFKPQYGENAEASEQLSAVLKPDQWDRLIQRLGEIDNPIVPLNPSKSALRVTDPTGTD
ncbi:lytic murein transglycosylase [Solirubrobacter sp. CPCC 204708]|nr:lytic murein transglycosylase [Solirubrobacter deserti]